MNILFRRLAFAMGLGLPLGALAQSGNSEAAKPDAAVPQPQYRSAFADYKPWQDLKPSDWRTVNDNVRDAAVKGGTHAGHAMPAAAPASTPTPKASVRATPVHGGQHMPGGKQ